MSAALEEVLAYARRGWAVFPCVAGDKAPLTPAGFKNATTDEDQIRTWAAQYPGCNWGIACGVSGLFVVDIDPRNGGVESFDRLVAAHGPVIAPFVETGGG